MNGMAFASWLESHRDLQAMRDFDRFLLSDRPVR